VVYLFQFIFPDSKNKVIFTTNDYGKTIKRQSVDFEITDLAFHEEEPETIIILDASNDERKVCILKSCLNVLENFFKFVRLYSSEFWDKIFLAQGFNDCNL